MSAKKMLTIKQIAEEYNICRDYIDEALRKKELPFYMFGKKTRYIKRSDLEKWIEQHKNPIIKYNSLKVSL
jgi:excisionase family DNA binding protein